MRLPIKGDYPKSLWIGGSKYTIKFKKFKNTGLYGQCDPKKREIQISNNLSPVCTLQTVLHEIFHALLNFEGKSVVTHSQVYCLEKRFAQLLMDNWFIDEPEVDVEE